MKYGALTRLRPLSLESLAISSVAVVRAASFTKAWKAPSISKPCAGKQVAALEERPSALVSPRPPRASTGTQPNQ